MRIHVPFRIVSYLRTLAGCVQPHSGILEKDIYGKATIVKNYKGIMNPSLLREGQVPFLIHAFPCSGQLCGEHNVNFGMSTDAPTPDDIVFAMKSAMKTKGADTLVFTYEYVYTISIPQPVSLNVYKLYGQVHKNVRERHGPVFISQWLCGLRKNGVMISRNYVRDPLEITL